METVYDSLESELAPPQLVAEPAPIRQIRSCYHVLQPISDTDFCGEDVQVIEARTHDIEGTGHFNEKKYKTKNNRNIYNNSKKDRKNTSNKLYM